MAFPVVELLLRPDTFFARVTSEAEDLVLPALIIGIGGIILCVSDLALLSATGKMGIQRIPLEVLWDFLFVYLVWVFSTLVLFILSLLLSGTGTFTRTLQNTGYGMFPWVISQVFSFVSIFQVIASSRPEEALQTVSQSGVTLVLFGLGILFMLWTGYLWIFGLKHSHRLSTGRAAIPAACLIVFYLIVILVTYPGNNGL
jgi:hypothetical protein